MLPLTKGQSTLQLHMRPPLLPASNGTCTWRHSKAQSKSCCCEGSLVVSHVAGTSWPRFQREQSDKTIVSEHKALTKWQKDEKREPQAQTISSPCCCQLQGEKPDLSWIRTSRRISKSPLEPWGHQPYEPGFFHRLARMDLCQVLMIEGNDNGFSQQHIRVPPLESVITLPRASERSFQSPAQPRGLL